MALPIPQPLEKVQISKDTNKLDVKDIKLTFPKQKDKNVE